MMAMMNFQQFNSGFKGVNARSYSRQCRVYMEQQGPKKQNLDEIDRLVYESFVNERKQYLFIHEIELKRRNLSRTHGLNDTYNEMDNEEKCR